MFLNPFHSLASFSVKLLSSSTMKLFIVLVGMLVLAAARPDRKIEGIYQRNGKKQTHYNITTGLSYKIFHETFYISIYTTNPQTEHNIKLQQNSCTFYNNTK
jgi:hypothetical protein